MDNLKENLAENQTIEKSALIVAGGLLIPAGISLVQSGKSGEGLGLVIAGIVCLLSRELLKLKK